MLIPNQPTISTFCASNACVEATAGAGGVTIRDSRGAAVVFTTEDWRRFAAALKTEGLNEENRRG